MLNKSLAAPLNRLNANYYGLSKPILERPNALPNVTMFGGSPPSASSANYPTGWSVANTAGLTTTFLARGTDEFGNYSEWRISGTTTDASTWFLAFAAGNFIPAVSGEVWDLQLMARLVGGTLNNVTGVILSIQERNSSNAAITESTSASVKTAMLANLNAPVLMTLSRTLSSPNCAFVRGRFGFTEASGTAIDATVRLYENGFLLQKR